MQYKTPKKFIFMQYLTYFHTKAIIVDNISGHFIILWYYGKAKGTSKIHVP